MYRSLFTSFFLTFYFSVTSQSSLERIKYFAFYDIQIDSLYHQFEKVTESNQVIPSHFQKLKYLIGAELADTSNVQALYEDYVLDELVESSELIKIEKKFLRGLYLIRKDQLIDAEDQLEEVLETIQSNSSTAVVTPDFLGTFYTALGGLITKRGDIDKAHELAKSAEALLEEMDLGIVKLKVYRLLRRIYEDMASSEIRVATKEEQSAYLKKAKEYLNKSLYEDYGTNPKIRSLAFYDHAMFYNNSGDLDSAIYFLEKCISEARKIQFYEQVGVAYNAMTNMYIFKARKLRSQMMLDTVGIMIDSASKYAAITNSKNLDININLTRANMFAGQNKFAEALPYVTSAIKDAKAIKNYSKLRVGYHTRYVISKYSGELDSALYYFQRSIEARDSILNKASQLKIANLDKKYQTEKIERENLELISANQIQNLKIVRKNLLIGIIVIGAVAILVVIYLQYRRRESEQAKKIIQAEQKLLRSQLNPHFLFNALNAIQQYIYQEKDPGIIADYLGQFSKLTRRILVHTRSEFINLSDEIEFIKDYLAIQQIRFDNPFTYEIIISEELSSEEILIPPMVSQPFIENCIEHGIMSKQGKGEIIIKFEKNEDDLLISIQDNGIGINKASFEKRSSRHRSLAIKFTKERLEKLSIQKNYTPGLAISDLSDLSDLVTGTLVKLRLPIVYA